jgi:hypothetical protein
MADVSKALNVVRKLNPMGFFSRATEEAQRLPQAKGTGEQMRAMLLKQGVKPDELKWTGFDEWAKGKKSVTRDEITEFLRRNEVQLGEKRLSGKEEYGKWEPEAEGVIGDVRQVNVNPSPTKFEQYTLPGGKDYNELLLTRPGQQAYRVEKDADGSFLVRNTLDNSSPISGMDERQAQEAVARFNDGERLSGGNKPDYRSQHWDDPNVLAHMRMSGRTDPEGRRVLHLEELQSDWAQEGRKKGFVDPKAAREQWVKDNEALKEKYLEAQKQHSELADQIMFRHEPLKPFNPDIESQSSYDYRKQQYNNRRVSLLDADPDYRASAFNLDRLRDQTQSLAPDLTGTVPPAPFVESTPGWTNLALKRAMIEAARGNYDAIAWTPGAEQAKRFDLSKQIDDIRYAPSADGRTVSLEAYRGGENIFNHTNMPIAKLDEFVGRDVAERIAKGVGETDPNTGYRVLSGLDLQVGGEGMKGYYDKILPTQIGKVLKDINETPQFGTVNVPTPTRDARYHRLDDAELMAELRQNGDPPQSMTLPSINLTPQMREKINQGLPLFTMMPAAVGLGATASQMQEGQNPAVEGEGFADGGKIVRKALEAVRGLPKAVGLDEFMPAAGERRLPKAVGLEEFMRGAGERRLPSTPSIEEFMPAAREHRLPDAVGLEEFMPAAREPRLPEAVGLEEFMPIDRAGGGKVVGEALQAIRRNRENGGPVDMRAGEMIGLRARLGLSPRKITDRAGPIHTDPAVAARDAAAAEENPAVVEQALDVVRSQPRQPVAARPLTIPAPRSVAPEPSESQRLWQLYNESENPADFVRADEAMRAGRADGGRLLEDQYPSQYLPNVGRQVMQDGGTPNNDAYLDALLAAHSDPNADIRDYQRSMGQIAQQPEDVRSMTHAPSKPMRPIEIEGGFIGKRQLGQAPYDVAGPLSGMAQTAYSLKTLPFYFTPAAPFAAASDFGEAVIDTKSALDKGDYLGAGLTGALGVALPAAAYRKQIGNALSTARDVLGRAPVAAGAAAGAAAMTPEEAQAGKADAITQGLEKAIGIVRKASAAPDLRASTRFPTGAKASEDPLKQQLTIGPAEMKASPGFGHNMGLLAEYPGFSHLKGMSPEDQLSAYIEQARGNLNFLYEKAPEIMRQRSPVWYEGANNFSDALASRYGIPRQSSSAAIAALSPQMDWFKNASLAERVGDVIFSPTASSRMTPEMEAFQKASPALTSGANQLVFDTIRGKKFSDLTDPLDQALWIRLYDEAHNPRNYRSLSPEGNLGDYIKSGSGEPAKIGWGSLNEIAKAVRAYTSGGDMNVISPMLGTKHKVRSFYNNIELPGDQRFGDVTADTHAVAASQLRPLSGNTPAVAHNLASGLAKNKQPPGYQSEKSSSITGVQGTYGANAEATRLAAADQGLLPREMQSATWEPVRELFPAKWKTPRNIDAVDNIWRQKDAGNITAEQARKAILDLAGGFSEPSWAERGFTAVDPRRASTYR